MKFDIYNRTTKQNENGVYANSQQELIQLYKWTDEDIQITKVYNESPNNDLGLNKNPNKNNSLKENTEIMVQKEEINPDKLENNILNNAKFFTDNGIEYKIDSTGSYKKTWVDADQSKFRIINCDNGKEIKMTNKKIQIIDWVKIGV